MTDLRETVAAMVRQSKLNTFISRIVPWRVWVQSAFLLVWLDPAGLRLHNICGPVFHCYACPLATFACPIGVIAQFGAVHLFPFMAVGLLITLGALFGSVICGWVCPFGLLQDLAAKVPVKKFKLPKWSGHFRYVVLVVAVLAVPYFFGEGHWLFICRVCPAGALEKAVPDMISQTIRGQTIVFPSVVKLGILGVFLVAIFISIRRGVGCFVHWGQYLHFSTGSVFFRCSLTSTSVQIATGAGRCAVTGLSLILHRTLTDVFAALNAQSAAPRH